MRPELKFISCSSKACLLISLGLSQLAVAQLYPVEPSHFEEKQWVEQEAALPAYPKEENLLPVNLGEFTSNRFFVDPDAISVGDDGVVRYTLVVKSSVGAVNVSYEGMRCDTKEWKAYGFGGKDGKWQQAKNPVWRNITRANVQHFELYKFYYCRNGIVRKPQEAINYFKLGASMENKSRGAGN